MLTAMEPHHIGPCAELFLGAFSKEPFNYTWLKMDEVLRYFRSMMASPGFMGFVWREDEKSEDGRILACCIGHTSDYFGPMVYDIKEIVVDTNHHGRGIGSFMLSKMEEHLMGIGVTCITLMTDRRIPAYGFYMKNGYIDTSENVHLSKQLV